MSGLKSKIDKYFTENYDYLIELATGAIQNRNRPYDPAELVSYAYERALISCQSNPADCVCHIILKDCYWNNSYINREILLKQTPFEGTEDYEVRPVEVDDCETLEKVRLEKWFNDRKSLLAMYRERIKVDKPKQIVLDKMIELKTTNSRKLGKHFGIHYLSAYAYIREIQEEIRDFEEEVNTYDNKNVSNR